MRPFVFRMLAAAALVLAAACSLNTAPQPSALHEETELTVTGNALRIEVRALVGPYVGQIEAAANEAARRCGDDPFVRIRALEWKLNAVPLGQDALLQPDPVVALVDGWAYAVQMRDFLGGDEGREALGACHRDAAAAMDRIGHQEVGIATRFAPESVGRIEQLVHHWAADHPLASLSAPRATAAEMLATASARKNLGALAAVGTLVETLDVVVVRIAAYRETLNKEVRWAGELAVAQAGASDVAARALADTDRIAGAVDRIGALAAAIPALVEGERDAAIAAMRDERKAAMADIDAQRVDTLKALQAQTDAVMSRVDAISRGVMDRVDATSRMTVEEVGGRADHVVDRIFLRAAQMGLAFAVLLLVAAFLVARALGMRLRRNRGT